MSAAECRNGLAAQSRRQTLSAAEQERLREHLAVCEACRFDLEVGVDFDALALMPAGYELGHAKIADEVLRRFAAPPEHTSPGRWLRPALAAGLIAATAAAWAGVEAHRRTSLAVHASVAPAPSAEDAAPALARPSEGASPDAPPPAPAASAPALGVAAEVGASPIAIPSPPARARHKRGTKHATADAPDVPSDEPTAATLFERATVERQRKHAAAAIELYGELQRKYPASSEAHVSRVSLGRLLLEHGMPSEAVTQFDAYLADRSNAVLAPEALLGKARALDVLDRRDDARATWHYLLASFPASVYAGEAQRHLEAPR